MGSVLYEHVAKPEYHEVPSSRGEIEAYLLTSDEHGSTKEDENLDPSTVVHGVTSQRSCELSAKSQEFSHALSSRCAL
jgi:hypothetical protein